LICFAVLSFKSEIGLEGLRAIGGIGGEIHAQMFGQRSIAWARE
jgi:hypothetical protein